MKNYVILTLFLTGLEDDDYLSSFLYSPILMLLLEAYLPKFTEFLRLYSSCITPNPNERLLLSFEPNLSLILLDSPCFFLKVDAITGIFFQTVILL